MNPSDLLTIHTDGAARGNPGPAAFAYVIARDGAPAIEEAGCLGRLTNNQAEYIALLRALEHAARLGTEHRLHILSDSELMVKQLRGEYRVKNEELRELYDQVRELVAHFPSVNLQHIRREQNKRADALCNEALDGESRPVTRATRRWAKTCEASPAFRHRGRRTRSRHGVPALSRVGLGPRRNGGNHSGTRLGSALEYPGRARGAAHQPPTLRPISPGQTHLIPHKKAKNRLADLVVPSRLQAFLLDAARA